MAALSVIVPARGARRWQSELIERLRRSGHDISVVHGPVAKSTAVLDLLLGAEKLLFRLRQPLLSDPTSIPATGTGQADFTLDLAGPGIDLGVRWSGDGLDGLAAMLAAGELPDVAVTRAAAVIASGHPMLDQRIIIARALDDVLARVVTLAVATIDRLARGATLPVPSPTAAAPRTSLTGAWLGRGLPRLLSEVRRRLRYRYAHWSVGYRLVDGDGVAETGTLAGPRWSELADDGSCFYADPFPFHHEGRDHIFVEAYDYAAGRAHIAVSTLDVAGVASPPVPVLVEPYHLSYPQVFAADREIWMIPEASGGHELVLYRAEHFPHRWVRHAVLLQGAEISDATLLQHGGRHWLIATDRDGGFGSTSDTMVVFSAPALAGPWTPHRDNPIRIDRRAGRPAGAVIVRDGRLWLPLQDGTLGYGGGLAIAEILRLDDEAVVFSAAQAVATDAWPHPQVHTLNRVGRLEVIDGISAQKR